MRGLLCSEAELAELELKITELKTLQKELNDKRNVKLYLPEIPLSPLTSSLNVGASQSPQTGREFKELEESIDYRYQRY